MDFKKANWLQLHIVAFADEYATPADILDAKIEIKRRMKKKHVRMQNKQVNHYPK